ncbi:hypothetical protein HMPREF3212_02642 [Citrobacter freundii]|nr:hypothetical protein HMPREF3212_02642 [Citrobacter freundii]
MHAAISQTINPLRVGKQAQVREREVHKNKPARQMVLIIKQKFFNNSFLQKAISLRPDSKSGTVTVTGANRSIRK